MADAFVVFDAREMDLLFKGPDGPVGKALTKRAISTVRHAKRLAPVDTGRLRSSITHEVGGDSEGIAARVGTNVEYAPHLEYGTSRMKARPFLRPALQAAISVAWANQTGSGVNVVGTIVDS
jgi:HK97 gp10 family phage protein